MSEMRFIELKNAIVNDILAPAEAGRFITIGYQRQRDAAETINLKRQVTVYFSESEIPQSASTAYGKVMHDVVFKVEMAVALPAQVDLSVLNSETATEGEKATALRRLKEAGYLADRELDELIAIVYQILMDARNHQLGLSPSEDASKKKLVSNRWVGQIRKDAPDPDGQYLTLTASMRLTCRIEETIPGEDLPDTPPAGAVFESDIEINNDPDTKQGVKVTIQ
jgi:hypothetical protein